MADKEIKVGFEEVKLEALEFFLKQNDSSVEKMLKESLDKMYTKQVPQQVRAFVERNLSESSNEQITAEPVQEATALPQRRRRGQNGTRTTARATETPEMFEEEIPSENHAEGEPQTGMTMSM